MKQVSSYGQIDEHYLKDVFVPNYTGSKLQLSNSVSQLDEHWAEFRGFMQQVEDGKIPKTQDFKGGWQSGIRQDGTLIAALFSERSGLVTQFEKHKDGNLVYQFYFDYTNGCPVWARTMEDFFKFDEHGKVVEYTHR